MRTLSPAFGPLGVNQTFIIKSRRPCHLAGLMASCRRKEICTSQTLMKEKPNRRLSSNAIKATDSTMHRAFVALGSNIGDRLSMIERACRAMKSSELHIVRTSSLWETKAMYVQDQANFLNGVCEIKTSLMPIPLLDRLQAIETELGRVKVVDKGPRNIDLDILLFESQTVKTERLIIPHLSMLEREFVLRPLCQLIPDETLSMSLQPTQTFQTHLRELLKATHDSEAQISSQVHLSEKLKPLTPLLPDRKTSIMAILNLTPDSFSDGGQHSPHDISSLETTIRQHVDAGATIIDIGGQSSRPGAADIPASEEISRIVPAVKACRKLNLQSAISVDTYRSVVAEEAINAGAHIINDISAGKLDHEMLSTVAKLGCTYILMHMRGTPQTMQSEENCTYDGDIIQIVVEELLERIAAAEAAGIRRWRMILDPGIGFAKKQTQNLEILRRFDELRTHPKLEGFPWLIGSSRKGFVGAITGAKAPNERIWGTAATVAAAIQQGADIVRVHDVDQMRQVAQMADAIWRK